MHSRAARLLVGLFALAQIGQARAQTTSEVPEGKLAVSGYGVGMEKTCGAFIRETDEGDATKALDYEGKVWHPERRLYYEWLSGFFTYQSLVGARMGQGDVLGDRNMNDMILWVRHYCEAHPLDTFLSAALKLSAEVSRKGAGAPPNK